MIEKAFNTTKEAWDYMVAQSKAQPEKFFTIPLDRPFTVLEKTKEEQNPPVIKRDRSGERNYKVHWADIPEYISPVTRKPVDGRAARREDMKRSGCREVDPSEGLKDGFINERFANKHGLPFEGKNERR